MLVESYLNVIIIAPVLGSCNIKHVIRCGRSSYEIFRALFHLQINDNIMVIVFQNATKTQASGAIKLGDCQIRLQDFLKLWKQQIQNC